MQLSTNCRQLVDGSEREIFMKKCFHEKPELKLSFHSYGSRICICEIGDKNWGIDEDWIRRYSEPYEKKPGHFESCIEYRNVCFHMPEFGESCGAKENCEFVRPFYIICDSKCTNKDYR